jgi:type IV pilus assembly protein PilB
LAFVSDDSLIIRTWQEIATSALKTRASDIHVEAQAKETVVRIRVDGYLRLLAHYSIDIHDRLISRIKILSRLDIAEKRVPQDGSMAIGYDFANPNIDCRVSILPTLYGEKAVVRILPSQIDKLVLGQIGLLPEQLDIFEQALAQTNGLILVTGPTGSGKTRTLYSCLNQLNRVNLNLCSVEDPIEIRLPGVNQVAHHPNAGLDFETIIRALLRQDPDVLMIGEIRDAPTAKLAIQAAQTGHLVLSTLHTRNALGALDRLHGLGIHQEAIASCLRCVSSQRLVPKRCIHCLPESFKKDCSFCQGSGYFERIGIHEVLGEHQILKRTPYLDLHSAGIRHIHSGVIDHTSLEKEIGTWQ